MIDKRAVKRLLWIALGVMRLSLPLAAAENPYPTTALSEPPSQPATNQAATTEPATTEPATTEPATQSSPTNSAPTTQPATSNPSADEAIIAPAIPALSGLPEGTYLKDLIGRAGLASEKPREIDLLFDFGGKQVRLGMLPGQRLMQIEKVVDAEGWNVKFRISGTITEYKGRNYLMLERAGRADAE